MQLVHFWCTKVFLENLLLCLLNRIYNTDKIGICERHSAGRENQKMGIEKMMTFDKIATATIDQLTDELSAAGWDSTQTDVQSSRDAVARLLHETAGPFDLRDSETNDDIRDATADEAAESACAGPEGHILVNGRRCYVGV